MLAFYQEATGYETAKANSYLSRLMNLMTADFLRIAFTIKQLSNDFSSVYYDIMISVYSIGKHCKSMIFCKLAAFVRFLSLYYYMMMSSIDFTQGGKNQVVLFLMYFISQYI